MEQDQNDFISKLMLKLNGKVSDDELKTIIFEIQMLVDNYDIQKRKTEIVPYEDIYGELKTYLVAKRIEGRSMGTLKLYKLCLFNFQMRKKVTNRTLDSRRLIINAFFTWLYDENYISKNPSKNITPIKYEIKEREPFTDIEMEVLRGACETKREKAILEMFYSTGCRVSELAILKIKDIDFSSKEVLLFGKGSKYRISYLNARAEVAFKNYLSEREDDSEYAFVSMRKPHKKLNKEGIEKILRIIGKRAGIDNVFPHRIRHTTATDAIKHGMPLTNVQNILGHSRLETTKIYIKTLQEDVSYNHKKCII